MRRIFNIPHAERKLYFRSYSLQNLKFCHVPSANEHSTELGFAPAPILI